MSSVIPEIRVYSPSETTQEINNKMKRSVGDYNAKVGDTSDANKSLNGLDKNEVKSDLISWENTFHMRNINLMNFGTNLLSNRSTYRSHAISLHRQRMGGTSSTHKSLNILRQALQQSINKEINEVIQKYLDRFFRPAIDNIRNNNGPNSVSEQHIQAVCQQILEESKKMYFASSFTRSNSPAMNGVSSNGDNTSDNENNNPTEVEPKPRPVGRPKRVRDSDSDSEVGSLHTLKPIASRKGKHAKHSYHHNSSGHSGRSTPTVGRPHSKTVNSDSAKRVVRDSKKWDPNRLSTETLFVLGSKANKALGFGSTRGRLYTKHADLFRYIGDQEDKQWLHDNHLMPPAGGRAYLLIKEDILDLIESDEYNGAPGVNANDMGYGFTVPQSMITKMQAVMDSMRNSDMSRKKIESKSRALASNPLSYQLLTDNSNTNQSNDTSRVSRETSLEPSRPESVVSPADDLELPSADPSPFSIGASCFESDVSPTGNDNQISPIPSVISTNNMIDI
ncbi:deoxynucleotidyltransferase terminal-interacting protein 1-like [Oppia nitens]|uniref:deoxynucleotidyltransferase terminal-interacting protein 1-like n=1 Tax=Oppia nitens TaxID=1686743 RepID=UPI0023DB8E3B|nr:deoxynucleotidyltransferase terminal-interacting protein 1-like [Oppia nitens]